MLPKFLRIGHTPARPPKRTHAITAAMRERAKAGGWQELTAAGPFSNGAGTEILMTDGTVLVQDYCSSNWERLTPDKTGSYQNGTWSKIAAMPSSYGPLYFASAVLSDGKLIVNGGEYNFCAGAETPLGAIYDPVANSWTAVSAPSGWSEIGDGQSAVLSNGTYMIGNCCTEVQAEYSEGSSTWTQVGTGKHDTNSEEGWTLLRSGELLDADVFDAPYSELFNPQSSSWSAAGNLPVNLTSEDEIGPQTMMPNDEVFVAGANGETATYSERTGKWKQGPNFPMASGRQLDIADGPSSVLPDGQVMLAASPGVYSTPAQVVLYNGKKFTSIATPAEGANDSSYNVRLLVLPTGQVLWADGSNDVEIYTQKEKHTKGIQPTITSVPTSLSPGSTYQISGKRFNGDTQANFYGDDDQQASNYPVLQIINGKTGDVQYAKTHDINFMGIGSNNTVTTSFDVPSNVESGTAKLVVVVNGIPSKAVTVTVGTK